MTMMRTSTRLGAAAATITIGLAAGLISSGLIVDQSQAKTANPLAGGWTGMTEAGPSGPSAPISFHITNAGMVVGLTTSVTLNKCLPPAPATATMPSVRLNKPVPGYPKGKRFAYQGPAAVSVSGVVDQSGSMTAMGKVKTARRMEGKLGVGIDASRAAGAGRVGCTTR